jgi:hypothetical protein
MIEQRSISKKDFKRLTQHERVVLLRTIRLRMPLEIYVQKYNVKNLPHLMA